MTALRLHYRPTDPSAEGLTPEVVLRIERHSIEHSVDIIASAESVWQEVTQVDITSFRHPVYLTILGIPKPLRAEVLRTGVGGARIAFYLSDGPFRMVAGAHRISKTEVGTRLSLSSQYELHGVVGACLRSPVRLVLGRFQTYLLRGIRANAEHRDH